MSAIGPDVIVVVAAVLSALVAVSNVHRRQQVSRAMERRAVEQLRRRQAHLAATLPVRRRRLPLPVGASAGTADDVERLLALSNAGEPESSDLAA